jgi:hypothetical protein
LFFPPLIRRAFLVSFCKTLCWMLLGVDSRRWWNVCLLCRLLRPQMEMKLWRRWKSSSKKLLRKGRCKTFINAKFNSALREQTHIDSSIDCVVSINKVRLSPKPSMIDSHDIWKSRRESKRLIHRPKFRTNCQNADISMDGKLSTTLWCPNGVHHRCVCFCFQLPLLELGILAEAGSRFQGHNDFFLLFGEAGESFKASERQCLFIVLSPCEPS